MIRDSLAMPSGFLGLLRATADQTGSPPVNTQERSMSASDAREINQNGLRVFNLVP